MELILTRHSYSPTETMGTLVLPDARVLHTIERPWIPDPEAGSRPNESCVPDGPYNLIPHHGTDWTETWCLVNPALHVYRTQMDMRGRPGRYAILFHAGNWVDDVIGCIAVGLARAVINEKLAVTSSQAAMNILRAALSPGANGHRLIIQPTRGAYISLDG